jgi:hypothetical protein
MRRFYVALFITLWCRTSLAVPPDLTVSIVSEKKIWDAAPHNAFTDLAYWNEQFVCAFREGRRHVSTDGKIRVLTSPDGNEWRSSALIALDGYDLRDAGLSIDHLGRLMLIGGAAPRQNDNAAAPTGTFVAFSSDAHQWSRPRIVVDPGRWLWRITWQNDNANVAHAAFGVAYAAQEGHPFTSLLMSNNGVVFHEVVPKLFGAGYPTEAVLRFDEKQTMYCLQRRDGDPSANSAFLGVTKPPYTDWQWHDLGMYFGGPNLIQLPNGRWIAAGRVIEHGVATTVLAELNVEKKTLRPILPLRSGGDTSYPGLVWHDGLLWVSYYSSHEGKASIYLAKVKLSE